MEKPTIKITVDTQEIDIATEKTKKLKALLLEVTQLIDSLSPR